MQNDMELQRAIHLHDLLQISHLNSLVVIRYYYHQRSRLSILDRSELRDVFQCIGVDMLKHLTPTEGKDADEQT